MTKVLITSADGRTWWGCECLREWWPHLTREAVRRGLVKTTLDVTQGCYSGSAVAASASTHNGGGVADIAQTSPAIDDLLEEMGAAAWQRDHRDGMPPHTHLILRGCPHLDPSAAGQVDAWGAGLDGLVRRWPDRDTTRPNPPRNWKQGIQIITRKDIITMDKEQLFKALDEYSAQVISEKRGITVLHNWAAIPWAAGFGLKKGAKGTKASDWRRPMEYLQELVRSAK